MTPTRRGFITGLIGLVAAPAIVRAASLMPVSVTTQAWLSADEMVRRLLASLSDGAHFSVRHALPGDPEYQRGMLQVPLPSLNGRVLTLHGPSREGRLFEMPARA